MPFTPSWPPYDWIVPQWPAPPHVHAVFTTRQGGVSQAPFDSLNLGDHVRDDARAVAYNRQHLLALMRERTLGLNMPLLQQVHGTEVHMWSEASQQQEHALLQPVCADACVSTQAQHACTVMVADCVPVLFTNRKGNVVGAAHAGWRGLQAGILEEFLSSFWDISRMQSSDRATENEFLSISDNWVANETLAWIGPCIGAQAFEVGEEVRTAFVSHSPQAACAFNAGDSPGKYWADLVALTRMRLRAAGVEAIYGNDGSAAWCTVTQASRFFSHRRDAARLGSSGRMAATIWIDRSAIL